MTYDVMTLGAVALSIVFLAVLVWLMIRAGSRPEWAAISQGAREARNRKEKER